MLYVHTCTYLRYESQYKEESCQGNDPSREDQGSYVDVSIQNEVDENNGDQHNTGYVDKGSHKFGVVQNSYFDSSCLEGQDDSHQLQQTQVHKA